MLTLDKSNEIIVAILKKGREMNLRPLCVVVTDIGAKITSAQREDGCSQARIDSRSAPKHLLRNKPKRERGLWAMNRSCLMFPNWSRT